MENIIVTIYNLPSEMQNTLNDMSINYKYLKLCLNLLLD